MGICKKHGWSFTRLKTAFGDFMIKFRLFQEPHKKNGVSLKTSKKVGI
jgi:hypothetical protein